MNEEIEECKIMAWKMKPLSRRRVLARLERCGTRQVEDEELPPEGTAIRTRRIELVRELGSDVDDGLGKQR